MKIYLSEPGFICAAGDSSSSSEIEKFTQNIFSGNTSGIVKIPCGLKSDEQTAPKSFYAGKIPDSKLKPTGDKFDSRFLQILDFALNGIAASVSLAVKKYGEKRVAVCVGQCDNGSFLSLNAYRKFHENGKYDSDYDIKAQGADYAATFAAKKFGLDGPALSFATACSSSASAIVKAAELIKSGIADAVVAGGADIASDTVLLGFDSLEAVSKTPTNPFSKNRSGITLGEGAAFFVLSKDELKDEKENDAVVEQRRNHQKIAGHFDKLNDHIVLSGWGESSDANHMTAPLADGSGAESAMKKALKSANLNPSEIGYVNLHGTGTRLNDSMEAKAVDKVFGSYKVPCSTTKPLTGHTLGAAGALELAICFYAINRQEFPVQVWDGVQDDEMPVLNIISQKSEPKSELNNCMTNSFAFGGCNVSLIISKEEK